MKKSKKIVSLFLLLLLILSALALFQYIKSLLDSFLRLSYAGYEYPETGIYLDNPYRGFYHIYGYSLKNEISYGSPEEVPHLPGMDEESPTDERLVQLQINLRRFADRPLTEAALQQLDIILDAWSRTDRAIILRPLYDWDARAMETEPENIEQILTHMEQTAGVYNRYADSIFMLQGLSTGNTGEMNNTNYGSPESLGLLASKLTEVSDPSIYLSVRTPRQWRSITGLDSLDDPAVLAASPYSRLGLFNDGMLGSESDTGTYTDRSREEELAFQDILCGTVPNGGEVITDNPYNDLENAITDMRRMHISHLNSIHDINVINKWKESVYHGNDVFDGVSGYEYIREHLGYRYVLRDSRLITGSFGQSASLILSIENVGFSASYRSFSFQLSLINTDTGESVLLAPEQNSMCLRSSEITVLEIPLNTASYPLGTYELYWQTTDDITGEVILYGNDIPLTKYGYPVGSLTVEAPYRFSGE